MWILSIQEPSVDDVTHNLIKHLHEWEILSNTSWRDDNLTYFSIADLSKLAVWLITFEAMVINKQRLVGEPISVRCFEHASLVLFRIIKSFQVHENLKFVPYRLVITFQGHQLDECDFDEVTRKRDYVDSVASRVLLNFPNPFCASKLLMNLGAFLIVNYTERLFSLRHRNSIYSSVYSASLRPPTPTQPWVNESNKKSMNKRIEYEAFRRVITI